MDNERHAIERYPCCSYWMKCDKTCPTDADIPLEFWCEHAWEFSRRRIVAEVQAECTDLDLSELNRVKRFIRNQVKAKRKL